MYSYNQDKKEKEYLEKQKSSHPDLFKVETIIEDDNLLKSIGITSSERLREIFYVKTSAVDFIVEEKNVLFGQTSVSHKVLTTPKDSLDKRTIFVTLVKCNMQTTDAIADIARKLGISTADISYAGLKDKKAITSQTVAIRKTKFENLLKVISPYYFLKDATYGNGILKMGDLVSNQFTICLRPTEILTEETFSNIEQKIREIEKNGFRNFYYLQRFSAPRYTNMQWGFLIFKGEFSEAIKLSILQKGQNELSFFQNIRDSLSSVYGDWKKMQDILEPFNVSFSTERRLIDYLVENPNDYLGALRSIPEQVRLWIYSVPSYFFNVLISNKTTEDLLLQKKAPLILTKELGDLMPYRDMLMENDLFPVPDNALKNFNFIEFKKREVSVLSYPHNLTIKREGELVLVQFSLEKGEYATTFLSQVVTLAQPGEDFMQKTQYSFDTVEPEFLETLQYFVDVIEE